MHLSEKTHPTDFIICTSVPDDQSPRPTKKRKLSSLIPDFSIETRLAVVTQQPLEALGASNFITACVAEFYEEYRQKESDFFVYPDYFTLQLTSASDDPVVDYGYFDIWPTNKNIRLDMGTDQVCQLIDELSIDILLLPFIEIEVSSAIFNPLSVELPVEHFFLYGTDGTLDQANFSIQRPMCLLDNSVETVVNSVPNQLYARQILKSWQHQTHCDSWITEDYRQVDKKTGCQYLSFFTKGG